MNGHLTVAEPFVSVCSQQTKKNNKQEKMNFLMRVAAAAAERQEDDVAACSICLLPFSASEADHVPRLLQCGHSFCTACLTHLLGSTTARTNADPEAEPQAICLRCPKCRTATRVLLVGEAATEGVQGLPRNFDLIDLLASPVARDQKQEVEMWRKREEAEQRGQEQLAFDKIRVEPHTKRETLLAALDHSMEQLNKASAERARAFETEYGECTAELEEVRARSAAVWKAYEQGLRQPRGVAQSASWGDSAAFRARVAAAAAAARTAKAAAEAAAAVRGMRASSTGFARGGKWGQVAGSSGHLERRMAAAGGGGVVRDYSTMTAALGTLGKFGCPLGVAVDPAAGDIFVADYGNHQVHVWHANNCSFDCWKGAQPWGVALDRATGQVVLTNFHWVFVWRADDGTSVRTFGSRGSGPGQFQYARGVAVDKEGHVIVADSDNHRVHVWRLSDGSFLRTFGAQGYGPGQFQEPAGVAVDASTGHIIVTDSGNHRVHVWRIDGSFVRSFGSQGRGRGQFTSPAGVAVDAAGNIIVADSGNHRVQVWRPDGSFLRNFGSGQFNNPTGVAVDAATGLIIVADCGNQVVQVW
jgi:DNA-binding beta-propeller fold protein YncE/RNase P subunit RPR2